jgi:hypothetical protein
VAETTPDWRSLLDEVLQQKADPKQGEKAFAAALGSTDVSLGDVKAGAEREQELENQFFKYMSSNPKQAANFVDWYNSLPAERSGGKRNPFRFNQVKRQFFDKVDKRLQELL